MEPDSVEMEGQHSVSSLEEPKGDESAAGETSCSIPRTGPNKFLSKHRMVAAITLLQNQINFIQEELDQLDTFGESSIVCEELLSKVESIPDPLLPSTQGPVNASWDRWFKGTRTREDGGSKEILFERHLSMYHHHYAYHFKYVACPINAEKVFDGMQPFIF
ncbi:guanine nucleotide-binding protein [Salix suchowensis]|nr:guanine nucleotide-binding protein [Salix suchowensis]